MHLQTAHELRRRGGLTIRSGRAESDQVTALLNGAFAFIAARVVQFAASEYALRETEARRRVPRDPNDWTLVALALHLGGAAILTLGGDFLGCGLSTWTPNTLRAELGLRTEPPLPTLSQTARFAACLPSSRPSFPPSSKVAHAAERMEEVATEFQGGRIWAAKAEKQVNNKPSVKVKLLYFFRFIFRK